MSRRFLLAAVLIFYTAVAAHAQADRITEPIDDADRVPIAGQTREIPRSYADEGPLAPSLRMDGLTLYLKPSAAQQAALDRWLLDLHDPRSPNYHRWLTPEEYASRFGVSPGDAVRIVDWLRAEGFTVDQLARGRSWIVFHGTVNAVERAFQAGLHRYRVAGQPHYTYASNPSVPRALDGLVGAVGGLDDLLFRPVGGESAPTSTTAPVPAPEYTADDGTHYVGPDDLATIYDYAPLLQQGIDGTGQTIVVVGESAIQEDDLSLFRQYYNLPAPPVQYILPPNFNDPGVNSAMGEAILDLEAVSSVARNATIIYVYAANPYDALTYAGDQNLAPVITASFAASACSPSITAALRSSYRLIAQQANTQGITWLNASGDSGAAGCDADTSAVATGGLWVGFPLDIPEVTAVGGTEFNEQNGSYWSAQNNANGTSVLSYVPEMAWNDSAISGGLWSGGGGVSAFYPKPSWQTGPGVPNDGMRDVPDVSLNSSKVHDSFYHPNNGFVWTGGGGTSFASPAMAGMTVLVSQYLVAHGAQSKPGVGNLNQMLYRLAQTAPSAFHDITVGSNKVPCKIGTPNCTTGSMGYEAGPGYDMATGLGTVDVANLAAAALALSLPVPAPTLTPGSVANGATYLEGGLVPGSWAQVKGTNLSGLTRIWDASDFVGLVSGLPTTLGGTSVAVNGIPAALYYVSPNQVSFQVPSAVSGTVSVQVSSFGAQSNTVTSTAAASAPGIFPIAANGVNYIAGVFLDGKIAGDPSVGPAFRSAKPGDLVQLYATGLTAAPAGVLVGLESVGNVNVTIGSVTVPALAADLVAVGEFQVNFQVPQAFAGMPEGNYPVTISINGVSSPATINSSPPGPVVIPIRH